MRAFRIAGEIVDRAEWHEADIPFTILGLLLCNTTQAPYRKAARAFAKDLMSAPCYNLSWLY